LGDRVLFAECIEWLVLNGRGSEVRVMETYSKLDLEREWLEPGFPLFRPVQSP
jgi:hypothetical protein